MAEAQLRIGKRREGPSKQGATPWSGKQGLSNGVDCFITHESG